MYAWKWNRLIDAFVFCIWSVFFFHLFLVEYFEFLLMCYSCTEVALKLCIMSRNFNGSSPPNKIFISFKLKYSIIFSSSSLSLSKLLLRNWALSCFVIHSDDWWAYINVSCSFLMHLFMIFYFISLWILCNSAFWLGKFMLLFCFEIE